MAVIFILTGKIESLYLIFIIIALCIINKLDIVTGRLTFHQNYQLICNLLSTLRERAPKQALLVSV